MNGEAGCYVYGIVPAETRLREGLTGLDDAPVELVTHDDLAAVVSPVSLDRDSARRKDLIAHSAVLDACAEAGAVIPVRFGSVLADADHVIGDLLASDRDRLAVILADLAGKAQFTLRARYDEEAVLTEVVTTYPEIAELRRQTRDEPEEATYAARVRLGELVSHALESKRGVDGQLILDALTPHSVDYQVRESSGLDELIDVAFLVDDEKRPAFDRAAEDIADALAGRARLRLLGPLAPYEFVAEE